MEKKEKKEKEEEGKEKGKREGKKGELGLSWVGFESVLSRV